jgi:hypothetical protein
MALAILLAQAGCTFPTQRQSDNQEAVEGCRAEADRVYDAQNRYQLSERDSSDSPNSGSGTTGDPAAGLADRYSHERMVDNCLRHSAAVPVTGSGR